MEKGTRSFPKSSLKNFMSFGTKNYIVLFFDNNTMNFKGFSIWLTFPKKLYPEFPATNYTMLQQLNSFKKLASVLRKIKIRELRKSI